MLPGITLCAPPKAGSAPGPDYTITNDGSAGTANSFANILALGAATLSGKRIAIQALAGPTNYTPKTISLFPTLPVIFEAAAGHAPVIDQVTINGGGRIIFQGNVTLASTSWNSAPAPCVLLTGTTGNITLRSGVKFQGNYRGVLTAIDCTSNLPEYACISATMVGGVVTALTISNPQNNVSGLVADGVYALTLQEGPGGSGFSATMTVTGGVIVSTNLINGGSGYPMGRAPTNRITWAGQTRMIDYLPYGIQSGSGHAWSGSLTVTDCEFHDLNSAIKPGMPDCTNVVITGNVLDRIYGDFISLGVTTAAAPPPVLINWNFFSRCFSLNGDAGDPHSDVAQGFLGALATTGWPSWTCDNNVYLRGVSRGGAQFSFASDVLTNKVYDNYRVTGNLVASAFLPNAIVTDGLRDGYIYGNTVLRWDISDASDANAALTISIPASNGQQALGTSMLGGNITESLTNNGGAAVDSTSYPNTSMGLKGATIAYTSVMSNPNSLPTTLAAAPAAYLSIGAYAGQGASRSDGYVNFATRAVNLNLEPTFVQVNAITGATPSTLTTEATGKKMIGGPATFSVVPDSGLEFRFADDAAMSVNVSSWFSTTQTGTRGKYVQRRLTSSAIGSTTVLRNLSLNGYASAFSVKTLPVLQYTLADNGATAWARVASPSSDAGVAKALIGIYANNDSIVVNGNYLSDNTQSNLRLYHATTTQKRFTLGGSGVFVQRTNYTSIVGVPEMILIAVDLTQTTIDAAVKVVINGTLYGNSGGTYPGNSGSVTLNMATVLSSAMAVLNRGDGTAGSLFDGDWGMLYMDWGTSSYVLPNITDPAVQDLFSKDLINGGLGPTGSAPKLFYEANVASLNGAGIANAGSIASKPLVTQAGTWT